MISEGVNLVRRFGTDDGYRYVNALLDQLAYKHRSAEKDLED